MATSGAYCHAELWYRALSDAFVRELPEFTMICRRTCIRILVQVLTIVSLGTIACIAETTDDTGAVGDASNGISLTAWHDFRTAHPFHTQVVALSQPWS